MSQLSGMPLLLQSELSSKHHQHRRHRSLPDHRSGVGAVVDVIRDAIAVAVTARTAATEEAARGVQSDGGQAAIESTDIYEVTRSIWRAGEAAEVVVGGGEVLIGVLNNARIVGQGDQVIGAVEEQASGAETTTSMPPNALRRTATS